MMTPERRAEIEAVYDGSVKGAVPELLAEIDRMTAERDQLSNALDLAAAELDAQTKECPLSDEFDGAAPYICCGANEPDAPRCDSCGVPLVKHLGLTGTCAEKGRYLDLLRRVIRMSCLTVERCPAGYPDVAAFLREEARQASTTSTPEASSGK